MAKEVRQTLAVDVKETFAAASSFCFCSIGMLLFNKLAIRHFPLQCTLIAIQMISAAILLLIFSWKTIRIGSLRDFLRWCMVVPFFCGMLLTSLLALKAAPMSLVVVMRCLSPLCSMAVEQLYPDPLKVTWSIIASVLIMVGGACVYCSQMPTKHFQGVTWIILNSCIAVADRCLQRLFLSKDLSPVDISKTGVALINNGLGAVPMILAAYATSELASLPTALANLTYTELSYIAFSCLIGLGISYAGIWAQGLLSATSFLVMINANKFVIIFIEAFFMREHVLTAEQIAGALLTILGACCYGMARKAIENAVAEKQSLMPASA